MTVPTISTRRPAAPGSRLERLAWRIGLAAAERIRIGQLVVVLPDGTRRAFGDDTAPDRAEIRLHDRQALVRMLVHGETGGGEAYMDGLWSSPDLAALLRLAARNREALALSAGWFRVPAQLAKTLAHRVRRNTRAGSRRNIAAHYDLSNDLYRLFLDESMTYSSAVFETPDQDLADAQRNKYRTVAAERPAAARPARPGDRDGLGWVRVVRGGRARLPGDLGHDLARAVRAGPRTGP